MFGLMCHCEGGSRSGILSGDLALPPRLGVGVEPAQHLLARPPSPRPARPCRTGDTPAARNSPAAWAATASSYPASAATAFRQSAPASATTFLA